MLKILMVSAWLSLAFGSSQSNEVVDDNYTDDRPQSLFVFKISYIFSKFNTGRFSYSRAASSIPARGLHFSQLFLVRSNNCIKIPYRLKLPSTNWIYGTRFLHSLSYFLICDGILQLLTVKCYIVKQTRFYMVLRKLSTRPGNSSSLSWIPH